MDDSMRNTFRRFRVIFSSSEMRAVLQLAEADLAGGQEGRGVLTEWLWRENGGKPEPPSG